VSNCTKHTGVKYDDHFCPVCEAEEKTGKEVLSTDLTFRGRSHDYNSCVVHSEMQYVGSVCPLCQIDTEVRSDKRQKENEILTELRMSQLLGYRPHKNEENTKERERQEETKIRAKREFERLQGELDSYLFKQSLGIRDSKYSWP